MATRHRSPIVPQPRVRHRKSVEKLRDDQLQALRGAFAAIKGLRDNRGFSHWAGLHGAPGDLCRHSPQSGYDSLFLPWHRAYLYRLELALQTADPRATLPWWDWPASRETGIPDAYIGNPAENPLAGAELPRLVPEPPGWGERTTRDPGTPSRLPDQGEVERVLALSNFDDFSRALEVDLHNRVHGWVSGSMGLVTEAAYDPIFWAHHTMVDRLWSLWQVRHSDRGPRPGQWAEQLNGLDMTVADVLDSPALGYDYAGSTHYQEPGDGWLDRYTAAEPFPVPVRDGQPAFARADLRFLGVDHRGDSFEGRVFLDAADATAATRLEPDAGYAGSFYVFGHGPCFGDEGHCNVPQGPIHPFDFRRPHELNPQVMVVTVTEALRRTVERGGSEVQVTLVPTNAHDAELGEVFRFERAGLVTYD